jgi:hypothetical protein
MSPIVQIVLAGLPYLPALIADIRALFTKYPQLTPAQIAAVITATSQQTDAVVQDILATIAADVAAHPPAK